MTVSIGILSSVVKEMMVAVGRLTKETVLKMSVNKCRYIYCSILHIQFQPHYILGVFFSCVETTVERPASLAASMCAPL